MLLEFILRMLNKDWSRLTPNEIALLKDYIRYSASFEHTITELERGLHSTDDPKHIAMKTLITACEFYEADWCGILLLDLDIGCLLYTSPSPRDKRQSRMPSSA